MSFEVTYQNPKKFTVGVNENVFTATHSNPKKFTADIYPHVAIPPVFVSAEIGNVDNNVVAVLYDINIDHFVVIDVADYSVTLSGGVVTIIGAYIPSDGVTNKTVILVLSRIVAMGETGTFSYTGTTIRSEADDEGIAATLTNQTITNNVTGTAPVFISAAVANATPTKVVLTYDQTLDGASVPATTDFTVTDHTISGVAISGATVELTLSVAVLVYDVLYVTYTKGANPVQGDVGEIDADDLASTLVTNNVADDGDTLAYFDALDTSTVTKDGSNFVSSFRDKLGSGRNLAQGVGGAQPVWSADGITFDGVDNFMKVTSGFTWVQPEMIYLLVKPISNTVGDCYFDGHTNNSGKFSINVAASWLNLSAGTGFNINAGVSTGVWYIFRVLINGTSSKVVKDTTTYTGAVGVVDQMNGFTLGANAFLGGYHNFTIQKAILRKSAINETAIYNFLLTHKP